MWPAWRVTVIPAQAGIQEPSAASWTLARIVPVEGDWATSYTGRLSEFPGLWIPARSTTLRAGSSQD